MTGFREVGTEMAQPSRLLTPEEACSFLKIGRTTLWRMVRDGQVNYLRVRGLQRFDVSDLSKLLPAQEGMDDGTTG
jgi:excisionase family DNA binding protein